MRTDGPETARSAQREPPAVLDLADVHPTAERLFLHANGHRFHAIAAGPSDGSPVLLLHGFPEFWYTWRAQLPALADAGFRAVAVDLRGYNLSDRPQGVSNYRLAELVADGSGLCDALSDGPVPVVGHDWGGLIAWELAARRPAAVERLAILNAPHPAAYQRELRRPSQLLRSWYVSAFQVPWLPERLLTARNCAAIRTMLREGPMRTDAVPPAVRDRYARALRRPGAMRAAIDYYRALFRGTLGGALRDVLPKLDADDGARMSAGRIEHPALVLWGERDAALSTRLTEGLDEWVPFVRVERVPDASHWLHVDRPAAVNAALVEFVSD